MGKAGFVCVNTTWEITVSGEPERKWEKTREQTEISMFISHAKKTCSFGTLPLVILQSCNYSNQSYAELYMFIVLSMLYTVIRLLVWKMFWHSCTLPVATSFYLLYHHCQICPYFLKLLLIFSNCWFWGVVRKLMLLAVLRSLLQYYNQALYSRTLYPVSGCCQSL